ncbi:ribonuclease P protein component [Psychrobacter immobilis]|uniref:ribonuclease P protein component n=3 Tax=Psychrobacter TaxID=497 RepID=UPI001D0FAADC|nr:ribonuclease P protein component [Psychrobacter immobilis]
MFLLFIDCDSQSSQLTRSHILKAPTSALFLSLYFMILLILSPALILGCTMSNTAPATLTARFTKQQRLLTPAAFREVFDAPERKLHQSHLMAFIRTNAHEQPRVGMAITKRKVPTAVARNLIKRQIREQFRVKSAKLENKDIVFIVKKSIKDLDNKELKNEINNILKKNRKK